MWGRPGWGLGDGGKEGEEMGDISNSSNNKKINKKYNDVVNYHSSKNNFFSIYF